MKPTNRILWMLMLFAFVIVNSIAVCVTESLFSKVLGIGGLFLLSVSIGMNVGMLADDLNRQRNDA